MTTEALARSYFQKARKRLRALQVLLDDEAYSDVVREAQELVELALKGMLRFIGVEPPKRHDVGPLILQHRDRLPAPVADAAERLNEISQRLRDEREVAFYGDEDFIPTDEYTRADAGEAMGDARFVLELLESFPEPSIPPAGTRDAGGKPDVR
jgi:HEPN domain-containing protein